MEAVPYLTHKWNGAVATVDIVLFDIAIVAYLVAGIVAEFYKRIKVRRIGLIFFGESDLVSAQILNIKQVGIVCRKNKLGAGFVELLVHKQPDNF